MTDQKAVEDAAERYLSRQPHCESDDDGNPLYTRNQMLRAFCAGEIAIIDQPSPGTRTITGKTARGEACDLSPHYIDMLRASLEPFAKSAASYDAFRDPTAVIEQVSSGVLTVGDLRLARAAFDTPPPPPLLVGAWSLPSSIEKAILDHLSWIESNISDPRAQYGLTPTQLARTANEASNKLKEALVEYQANSGSAYWSNVLKDVISWVERTGVADNEPPEYLALIAAEAVASGAKARLVGANIPPPRVVDIDTLRNEVEKLCCRGRHDGSPLVLQDSVLALVDLLPRGTEKASYPVDFSKLYSHPLATSFHEMVKKLEGLGCSAEITSAINQLHALKGEVEAEINRQLWKPPLSEIIEALQDCEDYFDNRSDADCDQVGFIPNAEMALLSKVQTALEPFKVTKPVIDTSTEIE